MPHGLEDQRDRPGLGVGIHDRERQALATIVSAEDDELARLALLGDLRVVDSIAEGVRADLFLGYDLVHEGTLGMR